MTVSPELERVKRRFDTLKEIPFDDHDRPSSIGGSEVSCTVDMHPYKSAYQLWLEKRRQFPPEDFTDNDAVWFGSEWESTIIKRWCEKQKIPPAEMITRRSTYVHPVLSWMSFSPDAYHQSLKFGLEIKLVGYRMLRGWGIEMTDQIPEMYLLQVAWGAIVTRIPVWYIIAQMGTEQRTYKYVHRPELAKYLLKKARRFWRINVGRGIPPKPKGRKSDTDALKSLFPTSSETIRQATPHERALLQRYSQLYPEHKQLESEVKDLRAEIEALIGDDLGITDGHHTATWKQGSKPGKRTWGWRTEKEDA